MDSAAWGLFVAKTAAVRAVEYAPMLCGQRKRDEMEV
jgi:hypothetical protein